MYLSIDRLLESGRDFEESGQVEVAAAASSSQIQWRLLSSHGNRPVPLLLAAALPNGGRGISTTPVLKYSLEVLPTVYPWFSSYLGDSVCAGDWLSGLQIHFLFFLCTKLDNAL